MRILTASQIVAMRRLLAKSSETFVIRLTALMKDLGLTQQALSNATGINRTQLAKYATGRATPGIDNLATIALALGVSCDVLLGITPLPPPPPPRAPTREEIAEFILGALKP